LGFELLDLRVALIVSGGTFLVSLITSLLGGALFFTALLRGLVFGAGFFGIVAGIYYLYNKFLLPGEASDTDTTDTPKVGQNVDYSVDDSGEWLDMRGTVNGSLPPENTGLEGGGLDGDTETGGGQDGANRAEAYSGTEAPYSADAGDGKAEKPPGLFIDIDGGALEQSGDNVYIDSEATGHEKLPAVAKAETAASTDYVFDIDMSDFTSALPGFDDGGHKNKTVPPSEAEWSNAGPGTGVVDMSVARKSNAKMDLYSDADGKKMAGAIKTLLKKDEG
jgi:hypothetical protein